MCCVVTEHMELKLPTYLPTPEYLLHMKMYYLIIASVELDNPSESTSEDAGSFGEKLA